MSARMGLVRVLAFALMALPSAASAGAWTLETGRAIEIVTATTS